MPSPTRHASPTLRPSDPRIAPSLSSLVTLDLSRPAEKRAYEFLLYATDTRDPMWTLLDVQRHADVLLCVVRWVCPHRSTKPFAVAEVSLIESAVRWKHYATKAEAKKESQRRALNTPSSTPQHPKASPPAKATNPVP